MPIWQEPVSLRHAEGNLYGTTNQGPAFDTGVGAVFELVPKKGGGWAEKVLHSFSSNGTDGFHPFSSGLVLDEAGNLYGTTTEGGTGVCVYGKVNWGCGTVFEITP
jgi:hypothetical protein